MNSRMEKCFVLIASLYGILRAAYVRPLVVVYTNDMLGSYSWDPRMAGVYQWLEQHHIPFINLVHAVPHGQVMRYWWRRTSPVVYREGLMMFGNGWLSRFLRICRARFLFAIDDYRYWPQIVSAAAHNDMMTVLFQHGRFTRHQRYLALSADAPIVVPDIYVVWNEYWKSKLIAASPFFAIHAGCIRIGGRPGIVGTTPECVPSVIRERMTIMLVHESAAPREEMRMLVRALSTLPNTIIFYKVRGDQPAESQLAFLGDCAAKVEARNEVTECSVALGSYSTLLYELIERGIPVGILRIQSAQADDLVESGLASFVDPNAIDLFGELQRAAAVHPEELHRRAEVLAVHDTLSDTLNTFIATHANTSR
jgi:hypothetical protein